MGFIGFATHLKQPRASPKLATADSACGLIPAYYFRAYGRHGQQIKVQIRNPDKFLVPELGAKVEFLK